jgi:hypothetical protein
MQLNRCKTFSMKGKLGSLLNLIISHLVEDHSNLKKIYSTLKLS